MKKLIFLLLLISLNAFPQIKQDFSFLSIPKDLTVGANVVLRDYKETFIVENIAKATSKIYKVYTVLNKDGEEYAELSVAHDKFYSIKSFEGRLFDAFGKQIDRLKKSEIKEEHYTSSSTLASDDFIRSGRFSRGEYPYTVEFSYEVSIDGPMFYPYFHPQEDEKMAVEKASFEIIMPQGLKLRYKEFNVPKKVKIGPWLSTATSYYWEVNSIPVIKREILSPPFTEQRLTVFTAPTDFEIDGYKGKMDTWESFGKFINQLNAERDVVPEATKTQIQSLIKDTKSKYDKINILYNYMQSKTRYVNIQLGIGGWQPIPANIVDTKGYGDCKALSNYMKSILKVAGIESYYTLVYSGKKPAPVLKDFPSAHFNHAILCVPVEKDTVWLECTSQAQATGYLGDFTDNRNVLINTPAGGKFVKTPKYQQADNTLIRSAMVKIDADGNASVSSKTIYKGLQQDNGSMDYYAECPKDKQKKFLMENIEIPHFEMISFNLERKKERIPSVIETLELKIASFGSKSGKRIFISPNLMNKYDTGLPDNQDRKSEIVLSSFDFIDTDTVKYLLPENFHLEGAINDISFKSAFGQYSAMIKIEQGMITYVRRLSAKGGRFPKEKYKELQDFFKSINKADKMKIVLVSNT